MTTPILKECPFCGHEAIVRIDQPTMDSTNEPNHCKCSNFRCIASKLYWPIDQWNHRPPSSQKEPVWPAKKIQGKHDGHYFDENYCYVCMDIVEENDPDPTGTNYKWNDAIDACIKAWKDSL